MKTEKVVLSFIAVMVGLLVAGVAFFIYQSTKTIPSSKLPKITINAPSPTIQTPSTILFTIDQPADESVTDKKSITITGKTNPDAIIVVTTPADDQVVTPTALGTFSISVNITSGENQITLTAINGNGEELTKQLTITSSTEDF